MGATILTFKALSVHRFDGYVPLINRAVQGDDETCEDLAGNADLFTSGNGEAELFSFHQKFLHRKHTVKKLIRYRCASAHTQLLTFSRITHLFRLLLLHEVEVR